METKYEILKIESEKSRCTFCSELATIMVADVPYCGLQSTGGCCADLTTI